MYRNFICYRGGSSAGIPIAEDLYQAIKPKEAIVGKTYFSPRPEEDSEVRNFLNDPAAFLGQTENFVMLLTKGFFDGFVKDGKADPHSVTCIEIDQALKNENLRFIPVVFDDFSWDDKTGGITNSGVLTLLWGEEAMRRIVGSLPIPFSLFYRKEGIEKIVRALIPSGAAEEIESKQFDGTFKLESTPSVLPKRVFCGRDAMLAQIKDIFESGERVLFLQGIGGIGKTEIARQYAKQNKHRYDTIVYATYTDSVVELVSSQSYFRIDPSFPRHVEPDGSQEDDLSYFERKIRLIREITNGRTLIIIDNFDVMDDPHFIDLLDANYKLLFTTRCDYSRLYPTIKVEPLQSMAELRDVFLKNYDGYVVEEDDKDLDELIELVNRHTYTIELLAQHMENSGQTVREMIDTLKKEGIVSLNEEVRSSSDKSAIAYENLLRMFKVFNLGEEEKNVLRHLSLMPLSGVNVRDLKNWLQLKSLKVIKDLENRSWIVAGPNGIALHPIIRDVVRYELPLREEDAIPFLTQFNETIKEEKSWHFSIDAKAYYADIASEILAVFNKITPITLTLYRNVELLFSFSVKPSRAVVLAKDLYDYYKKQEGERSYGCGYCAFQAGWTYLFNMHLPGALENAKEWLLRAYDVFRGLSLETQEEFAVYGHCLTHLARVYLIKYKESADEAMLVAAREYAEAGVKNAEAHFDANSPFYSRLAVAYMQLADVCIANEEYDQALKLVDDAYDIMYSLFGAEDPDALNVSSVKSRILYDLGRYEEALAIGQSNLAVYTQFYGELNFLRFEQLVGVLKCSVALGEEEQVKRLKESAIAIGSQLLPENSERLKELEYL